MSRKATESYNFQFKNINGFTFASPRIGLKTTILHRSFIDFSSVDALDDVN